MKRIRLFLTLVMCALVMLFAGQSVKQQTTITFVKDIAPLLKSNCQPCHYPGGKVYAKLPFENYLTVKILSKKLHTRLKNEQIFIVTRWIESGTPER